MKHSLFQMPASKYTFLLLLVACLSCTKDYDISKTAQPNSSSKLNVHGTDLTSSSTILSQTRTANIWFNILTNYYVQWGVQYIAQDDNSYAYTNKIHKNQRIYLWLQDFRFTIPSNANIERITASFRRFTSGNGETKDDFVYLLTGTDLTNGWPYGVEMANLTDPWPTVETEAIYSQTGSGNNGIDPHDLRNKIPYQWTAEAINNIAFGFYLQNTFPERGNYIAYFDQVKITVEYSLP